MEKKTITPFPLRLEPELRKILEQSARENDRSLQAEIIARLMASAGFQNEPDKNNHSEMRRVALEVVREELARMSKAG